MLAYIYSHTLVLGKQCSTPIKLSVSQMIAFLFPIKYALCMQYIIRKILLYQPCLFLFVVYTQLLLSTADFLKVTVFKFMPLIMCTLHSRQFPCFFVFNFVIWRQKKKLCSFKCQFFALFTLLVLLIGVRAVFIEWSLGRALVTWQQQKKDL